ncbi:START-like domain-containing protein [Persicitalea sp.]|uniref:START-like domain-containing protein n=1 Tax=Persicitalea sp. TaxID=3100273 RepID=UPI003593B3EE
MKKHLFNTEFEIRSSPKVLYPYISTAAGLEQWFAEKVTILPDNRFDFQWDGDSHPADRTSHRLNKSVRFEFTDNGEATDESDERNYVEMKLEVSDLTQSTYLRVVDYSQNMDEAELSSLWGGLIDSLKELVGA